MTTCPDCGNAFLQPFVCITCGAHKLHESEMDDLRARLAAVTAERDALTCRPLRTTRKPPPAVWIHHDGYDWCVHLVRRAGLVQFASVVGVPEANTKGGEDGK